MDLRKLREWWWNRQGLDGSLRGSLPADVLARCGWARSVAGVSPYLTIFARSGANREQVDGAVEDCEIHELPAARGCTYVVPREHFPVALLVGQGGHDAEMKAAEKLGVTKKEVDVLCTAVLKSLTNGPLEPDAIRTATGKASRSLGDAGKKKGLTTTLPLAFGRLQEEGLIRRVSTTGRLDNQRYAYTLWKPGPLAKSSLSRDEALQQMAMLYFQWIGPATMTEFQWFSGLGVKAAQKVVEPLGLCPAEDGSDRLLLPEDLRMFQKFKPSSKPQYALLGSLDSLFIARRDISQLVDKIPIPQFQPQKAGAALADLDSHAIVDRGTIIGLWDFDPDADQLVSVTFEKPTKALREKIEETESFVRDQLEDARTFSLDSPKSRAPRLAALRTLKAKFH